MKKWLKRTLLACLMILIIISALFYFTIDSIIRARVQAATEAGLGQPTSLGSAHLALFSGTLTLSDLKSQNPPGYAAPDFLLLGRCTLTIQPRSLLTQTVRLEDITVDGLHLVVEQNQIKNNLGEIIQRLVQKNRGAPPQGKSLDIGKFRLLNTALTIDLQNVPGMKTESRTYTLAPLEMDHPTNPDGRLLKVSELTLKALEQIAAQASDDPQIDSNVRRVLKAVLTAKEGSIPAAIKGLLNGIVR